ncbi:hypothetical protein GCM10027051_09820 [Niabella terrae]
MMMKIFLKSLLLYVCCQIQLTPPCAAQGRLVLLSEHQGPVIGARHPDVLASGNLSGFETGQVIKEADTYHMFVNEMFKRPHRDLRISHWKSQDAIHWKRVGTVVESIPGRTAYNPKSEVWVNAVVFNASENAWNIFYVAYRAGDSSRGEISGNDYAGRIWRAKSVIPGREGIDGPYADMGILMQPDQFSQDWEGQQAVASFFPYRAGAGWFAMYDGHYHTPRGGWPTGMAYAPQLEGPWKRMPVGFNPLQVAEVFMENEIVYQLQDSSYLMIFDSFGDQQIGYSRSKDGIHWEKEERIRIQRPGRIWAEDGDHLTRTPLCAIPESDGSFTVLYTARTQMSGQPFYAIGKCRIGWQR